MQSPVLRAVIFDLDGVLVDTSCFHAQAWADLVRSLGHEPPADIKERVRGISRMASLRVALGENVNQYTEEQLEEFATRKNDHYLRLTKSLTPADLYPGALRLIEDLKIKGIKVALGSASKNARMVLDSLQITEYFSAIIDGFSYKHGKPHPNIFLNAAEAIGAKPEECIVFEDAAAGIVSALDGGFVTVGIGEYESVKHSHFYIENHSQSFVENLIKLNEQHNRTRWHVTFDDALDIEAKSPNQTQLLIEGEPVDFNTGKLEKFGKWLDISTGMFNMEARWTSPRGRTIDFAKRYFSDRCRKGGTFIRYQIDPLNFTGVISLRTNAAKDPAVDGEVTAKQQNDIALLGMKLVASASKAMDPARATVETGAAHATLHCETKQDNLLIFEQATAFGEQPFDEACRALACTFSAARMDTAELWRKFWAEPSFPANDTIEERVKKFRSV